MESGGDRAAFNLESATHFTNTGLEASAGGILKLESATHPGAAWFRIAADELGQIRVSSGEVNKF